MASGWCWMVMNLQDSCSNHHPTTTRGFLRTVNWNLNGAVFLSHLREAATRGRKVDCLAILTRPVVPSTVSYVVRQQGNALSNAHGHRTHGHPTGTKTAREWCLYQQ